VAPLVRIAMTEITESQKGHQSLRASDEILRLLLEHAPAALAVFDQKMRYLAVSKRWRVDYFLGDRNVIGVSHYEIFPEIQEGWKSVHRRGLSGEVIRADEDRFERIDGTIQWLRWEVLPWRLSDGVIGGILVFSEDITRYKQAEDEIRHLNAVLEQRVEERTAQLTEDILARKQSEHILKQYAAIIDSSEDAIISKTLEGIITSWNSGAERIFGYSREEALGQPISFLIPEDYQNEEVLLLEQIRNGDSVKHYEAVRKCKDGKLIDISLTLSPIHDQDGNIIGASKIARDITERRRLEDQVHQLAFYDELTKLPNRRLLNDRLSQAMAASKRSGYFGAVMFLDLDNFKPLNDKHGHALGDLLLAEVARRLKICVREIDTLARFGGDEFVVMLSELDADKTKSKFEANIIAEKIRNSLSIPYLLTLKQEGEKDATIEHHCTASIGVVLFINHEDNQEDLLKCADEAMYQAKDAGRNLIKFYDAKA
jgi:diguanylate cyclase (GGDEF)-like protein/PAS domain S-box-containing protein